jgi:protein lysine acetyltransferase
VLHTLHDGTRIVLRPIEAADKARLTVALGRLSQETIRRRFLAAKPSFSTSELRYLTEVDGRNHLALAAVLADDPEALVGVARCVRLPDAPDTAEFAIVVGDPFQGRGLGTLLARELAGAARAVGIRRFAATMLSDNAAVRRLMATISAHLALERIEGGVREVVVDLAA